MASTTSLQGKVALVTGAGRGIGKGIALEFAARGAKVVINYRKSTNEANAVVEEIKAIGSDAVAIQADVTKIPDIIRLFEEGKKAFGRLDIVMSNSGKEDFTPLLEVTPEIYDDVFNTNTRSQFFVAQQAYKHLEMEGSVILMSSIAAGTRRPKDHSLYAGSKNAIKAFVRTLSTDMGDKHIRVNAIAPGGVMSDMFAHAAWRYAPGGRPDMGKSRTAVILSMKYQSLIFHQVLTRWRPVLPLSPLSAVSLSQSMLLVLSASWPAQIPTGSMERPSVSLVVLPRKRSRPSLCVETLYLCLSINRTWIEVDQKGGSGSFFKEIKLLPAILSCSFYHEYL